MAKLIGSILLTHRKYLSQGTGSTLPTKLGKKLVKYTPIAYEKNTEWIVSNGYRNRSNG